MKIAVILGTSRHDGNTRKVINAFTEKSDAILFDLENYDLSFYDYEHQNINDDFLVLIKKLVNFDHLVFASPVYWYSMSAQLKVFIDRLSDLLTIEKELGRKLKGIEISLISTGYDNESYDCFAKPFELTAEYLQMTYKGSSYCSIKDEANLENLNFVLEQALEKIS